MKSICNTLLWLICTVVLPNAALSQKAEINWIQSFDLSKDDYVFHHVTHKNDSFEIMGSGKKKHYVIQVYADSAGFSKSQVEITKQNSYRTYWSGTFNGVYTEITQKQKTFTEDEIYLRIPSLDTLLILSKFRNDVQTSTKIYVKQLGSVLYVMLTPPTKRSENAQTYIYKVDSNLTFTTDTVSFPHRTDLLDFIQINLTDSGLYVLSKVYHINHIEKRQYKPNYMYVRFSYVFATKNLTENQLPLDYGNYHPQIKYESKCACYFGTYGDKPDNRALGAFVYHTATQQTIYYPFDPPTLNKFKSKIALVPKKRIAGLYPDLGLIDTGQQIFLFEQYYVHAVSGTAANATYNFYYNPVISLQVNPINSRYQTLTKYQKTFNDFGQNSSYKHLSHKNRQLILFNNHKKYVKHKTKKNHNRSLNHQYFADLQALSSPIKVTSNMQLPLLTSLTVKEHEGQYTVFAYAKRKLWIGKLTLY